jgi:3-methyl-2-oxobutanoate hydroxymethyltransferase
MKTRGERFTMLTAYDMYTAQIFDEAGIEVLLVGDSASNNVYGNETSLPVTVDELIPLTRAVSRSVKRSLVVGDLPFGSYQGSNEQAVQSAIRYLKEAGCDAVKLEMAGVSGAVADKRESVARARAIVAAGIPVMGHVGLTPQSASALGGYRTQGRTMQQAVQVADDALALQDAGCFAIVFEAVPAAVTEVIMDRMRVLGLYEGRAPRFVKRFADVKREMVEGVRAYAEEVRERRFPADEHAYSIDPVELERFREVIAPGKPWDAADFMS